MTKRQTDRQNKPDNLVDSHPNGNFFIFFAYEREIIIGVKFIPRCSLRMFALLT
jgi:hypothetical protein